MRLNFPEYNFKIKTTDNSKYVFDIVRKKYVALTPEEWVRQHVLHYLSTEKKFPLSLIAVEKQIVVGQLKKRFDILAFAASSAPAMLIECKAPDITLTKQVFTQAAIYNSVFKVRHLWITNGMKHMVCEYNSTFTDYHFLKEIPEYASLNL
jgi:hypothetical protein